MTMRFDGKPLSLINVDHDGIDTMDSNNVLKSERFSEKVRQGKFIVKENKKA